MTCRLEWNRIEQMDGWIDKIEKIDTNKIDKIQIDKIDKINIRR